MRLTQSFQDEPFEPGLPPGGMILERVRLIGWRSGTSSLEVDVKFPRGNAFFTTLPVGKAAWESEEWLVSFRSIDPLELVIVSNSGETVVEATLQYFKPENSQLKYRGRTLKLLPIKARNSMVLDDKLVLIRWEAWKDRDFHRDVTHFMWVDTNALGSEWPALATADELLLRLETARDYSVINEPI